MSTAMPVTPARLVHCAVLLLFAMQPLHADEAQPAPAHPAKADQPMQHGVGSHGEGQHGGHGAITKGIENFPSIDYSGSTATRNIEQPALPPAQGDPQIGKQLATGNKGRCLSCHVMGPGSDQAGSVGPNLSRYARSKRSRAYTFQQIWDARAHNPATLMPPFGANAVLSRHEVLNIVAYLETLDSAVTAPPRPQLDSPDYYVAGEDLTLADAYIEEGKELFHTPGKNGKSCASCHAPGKTGPALTNVASRYPKYDHELGRIMLIETRNNRCRHTYTQSPPYALGSRKSNTLSAYIKYLSRNAPIAIIPNAHTEQALLRGKQSFYKKTGQLNFSCADCHVTAAGQWLRGQLLSSIQPEGKHRYTAATWPKHFVALHDLGLISLQQRIRHCQIVTQTYPQPLGSQEYIDMELYITSLANGLPMQAPTKSKPRGAE